MSELAGSLVAFLIVIACFFVLSLWLDSRVGDDDDFA